MMTWRWAQRATIWQMARFCPTHDLARLYRSRLGLILAVATQWCNSIEARFKRTLALILHRIVSWEAAGSDATVKAFTRAQMPLSWRKFERRRWLSPVGLLHGLWGKPTRRSIPSSLSVTIQFPTWLARSGTRAAPRTTWSCPKATRLKN